MFKQLKSGPLLPEKKDVESFLGFMNCMYHRDHIPNYAKIALPLHEIVKPKAHFDWQEKHQLAFYAMKTALIDAVILNYPNSIDTFILDTDASNNTIGAELSQIQQGKEKPISFASKVLSSAQRKYCTTRKELLAIVMFTRQYRHYLLGKQFIIRTDHNSLIWLMNFKNIEGQLIPNSMKNQALELCHNLPISGHMGQAKTLLKLKQHVIWYKISIDCKLYVKSCSVCNKNKRLKEYPKAKLKQFYSGVPLERVHMDILGLLPITKNRNKYILMVIDQFTKWLECYPLPYQGAEIIAKVFVDNFVARFGCPLEIHTDQGENMDGNLIRQICKLLDINKAQTTPYHPSSNGQVERFNSLILQTVRCFIKKQQNKWDEYLQLLAGAIRATPSRQTGFSPNFLMFGREVTQPIDLTFGILYTAKIEKTKI